MREKSRRVDSTTTILQKRENIRLILRHTFTFLSSSCKDVLLDICFTTSSHYLLAHNYKDINQGKPESLPVSFFVHLHDMEERESDILSSSPFMRYPPPTQFASSISRWGARGRRDNQTLTHTRTLTQRGMLWHSKRRRSRGGGMPYILLPPLFLLFLLYGRGEIWDRKRRRPKRKRHTLLVFGDFLARDIRSPSSVVGWGN